MLLKSLEQGWITKNGIISGILFLKSQNPDKLINRLSDNRF
jgi:hypothetical protein